MNITNAMLDEYSNERIEDDDRPVLIDPGIYKGHLMNWEKLSLIHICRCRRAI